MKTKKNINKYKFKIGEIVYFNYEYISEIRLLRIIDRKHIEGLPYYKCEKIHKFYHDVDDVEIVKECDFTATIAMKSTILDNDDNNTFINPPEELIMTEWIYEKYLYNENHKFDFNIPKCGNGGCDIIENLLNNDNSTEINDRIHIYNEIIDDCKIRIDAYKEATRALEELIEQAESTSNMYRNKISILTDDNELYQKTFMDTIQD